MFSTFTIFVYRSNVNYVQAQIQGCMCVCVYVCVFGGGDQKGWSPY